MSRFLDQIRKAKEARERAAQLENQGVKASESGEAQNLVPDMESENQEQEATSTEDIADKNIVSDEAVSEKPLFPEGALHEVMNDDTQPDFPDVSVSDEVDMDIDLIPDSLAEMQSSDLTPPPVQIEEPKVDDLVPEMTDEEKPKPPLPPQQPDTSSLIPEHEKKESAPEEEVPVDDSGAGLIPPGLGDPPPAPPEEPDDEPEDDEDLFAEAERALEAELESLDKDKEEPEAVTEPEQEFPSTDEMEVQARVQRQEEARKGRERMEAEEKARIEKERKAQSEAAATQAAKQKAAENAAYEAKPEAETPSVSDAESNQSQSQANGGLFPSELANHAQARRVSATTAKTAVAEEQDEESYARSPEVYEPTFSRRPSRRQRRRSRAEIPVLGPQVDPSYLNRLSQIQLRPDKRVQAYYDPQNHVCEEYRLLGKNLLHTFASTPGSNDTGKAVVLTSSTRGEGKTLTSANLAMVLAQDIPDRVLIIDADMRHPKVHRYMGLQPHSGLNDMLAADDPESVIEDCVLRSEMGLHLLCTTPHGSNPAPVLDSPKMNKVLDVLRSHYSIIIIDTPPVLLATDALTVGVKSDGMLFLLRARKTQREQIQEARQRIARLEIRMLGYVINNVKSFLPQVWKKYYYGNY